LSNHKSNTQGGSAVPYILTEEQEAIIDEIVAPTQPVLTISATAG